MVRWKNSPGFYITAQPDGLTVRGHRRWWLVFFLVFGEHAGQCLGGGADVPSPGDGVGEAGEHVAGPVDSGHLTEHFF